MQWKDITGASFIKMEKGAEQMGLIQIEEMR